MAKAGRHDRPFAFGAPMGAVYRVKVPREEVIPIEANRNCVRATERGKEAGSEDPPASHPPQALEERDGDLS
jgi:hypothetical protein